jgi:carboxyl-terminal processing protease
VSAAAVLVLVGEYPRAALTIDNSPRKVIVEKADESGKLRSNSPRLQEDKPPNDDQALRAKNAPDLRQLNIESFEEVFNIIQDQFWDPSHGGLDWQAVGDELRPQIMKASTLPEARAILRDMISRLNLSHFAIIPADNQESGPLPRNLGGPGGTTGIDARVLDGKALVTSVAAGSTAERVGVKPGWEIVRINDFDVVTSLEKLDSELPDTPSKRVKMAGETVVRVRSGVGESVAITFRNGEGDSVNLTVPLGQPSGRRADVGNFGQAFVRIDVKSLGDHVGYIAVNKFLDPIHIMQSFNDAMESFIEAKGIVIDLRGNSGGKDAMALAMMGWLAPNEWVAGRLRTRSNETQMTVVPRSRIYEGPVAVLTDGLTGSSAEFMAAALQEMKRVRVVGTRTKGEALPAEYTKLPNGDVFLYAVMDFVTGAGKRLEGIGVVPDDEVALTQESLLEGRDLVLEAAVSWIDSKEHSLPTKQRFSNRKDHSDRRIEHDLNKASIAKYLGFYLDKQSRRRYEMVYHDGALAVRVPGMPDPLAFEPPDAEGFWALQLNPMSRIRFNEDKDGNVVSYSVVTPKGEVVRPRIKKNLKR